MIYVIGGIIDNSGGRRDWKRVYKVWGCVGACSLRHAPFAMIIQTVHYSTTRALYDVMWPYSQTKSKSMAKPSVGRKTKN